MKDKIVPAIIDWSNPETPVSSTFEDFYFSTVDGINESTHVFLQHNNIPDRWFRLKSGENFVIAETGFGTGLNFLVTLSLWNKLKSEGKIVADTRLHYISAEKHPLIKQDIEKAWLNWPEFKGITDELSENYPLATPGYHRIHLPGADLTLLYRDASEAFSGLIARVDCWFLDGFSPIKNPDIWQQSLFDEMANLSGAGTTFSTFTAARGVKEGLSKAGFQVIKSSGFGLKRNMLNGSYISPGPTKPQNKTPWFDYAQTPEANPDLPVAVIGAGIAGCSTSSALISQGHHVDLIEQIDFSAGPPPITIQGVLYVKLSAELSAHSEFYSHGYLYSLKRMRNLPGLEWEQTGVIQSAFSDAEVKRQQKFVKNAPYPESLIRGITAEEASEIAGIPLDSPALYFPSGAWVNPISLCQNLMTGANIVHNTQVLKIEKRDGAWYLKTSSETELGPYKSVVVACSNMANNFEQFSGLPVKPIRGQKSFIKIEQDNLPLKAVLCGKAYITPAINKQINFGATFNLGETTTEVRDEDHDANKQAILGHFPALSEWVNQPISMGIVGFRCTSPDYTPIVGPMPDWEAYKTNYKDIGRFKKQQFGAAPLNNGLYCNIGHGSRGLASALLSGEIIANQISGTPLPVPKIIADHLNPARFLVKKLKKGG